MVKKTLIDNKSNQTPEEQLEALLEFLNPLIKKRAQAFKKVEADLEPFGVKRYDYSQLKDDDKEYIDNYFNQELLPIISPQVIDPRHPFPKLRNLSCYAVYSLDGDDEKGVLGLIDIPETHRIIKLPQQGSEATFRYILLEDIILGCADNTFGDYTVNGKTIMRLTRNADINPDEVFYDDQEDYRQHVKKVLKKRLRLAPVRLEFQEEFDTKLITWIRKINGLSKERVFFTHSPIDLSYVFELEDYVPEYSKREVLYQPFRPQPSPDVEPGRPIYEQIMENDIMLFYPYESMDPFLELIHEAAFDPTVLSIKITLYRIAKKSKLAESLIAAAENGKEVTVLMELRARFDEENNIEWAERLEEAGCIVTYGEKDFKVHSKICQITRRVNGDIKRITHLGTGNYNEKTAGLYSDLSLMSAHEGIGADGNAFFRNMALGELNGKYDYLGVAPFGLKPLIMAGIDREIENVKQGKKGRFIFKMNSLTDREVIDKIAEASQVGVEIDLIIRGICCLLPGIEGKTENVRIRSIVGRMLEHARIYCFGEDADTIYLSSADLMTRNTERRVEIAYPVLDPKIRAGVYELLEVQLADNVKARNLSSEGVLEPVPVKEGEQRLDSQDFYIQRATQKAQEAGLHPGISYRSKIQAAPGSESTSTEHTEEVQELSSENLSQPDSEQGRFSRAMQLFGAGFRVLFGGKE